MNLRKPLLLAVTLLVLASSSLSSAQSDTERIQRWVISAMRLSNSATQITTDVISRLHELGLVEAPDAIVDSSFLTPSMRSQVLSFFEEYRRVSGEYGAIIGIASARMEASRSVADIDVNGAVNAHIAALNQAHALFDRLVDGGATVEVIRLRMSLLELYGGISYLMRQRAFP